MGKEIEEIADSFKTYNDTFNDIFKLGIETVLYCLDNDGVWKRLEIDWMIEYFISNNDVKKVEYLRNLKKTDFIAPQEKQDELNSKMPTYYKELFK